VVKKQKAETGAVSAFLKGWRRPTLAEPIGLLPSARLCLTAVFGMGTGRTTALWPPKTVLPQKVTKIRKRLLCFLRLFAAILKNVSETEIRGFSENYTQEFLDFYISRV
jgi:hypothetical protein